MDKNYIEKDRYERAEKRVKRIKGFYTHAIVYVVINIMLVIVKIQNLDSRESFLQWQNFTTLFFWGIGLLAHGISIFTPNFMLGKDWEERKIKELMEKDKKSWE